MTLIASHRGGALVWPENSPTAFHNTTRLAVEQVEFDVHLARDGRLPVIHDATVDRTTDGSGPVGEKTWPELAALRLKGTDGERMLELHELAEIFRPTAIDLRLEIKPDPERRRYAGLEAAIAAELGRLDMLSRTVITSFQLPTLLELRRHGTPKGLIWIVLPQVLVDVGLADVIQLARHHAIPALSIRQNQLDGDVVAAVRAAGLGIGGWAAHDDPAITKMLDLQVDVFTCDRPDRAVELRTARR
jgi:glycerophosphoryl diester phosphodiesterase